MKEIQGKSILVRVSEGSSYRESTVSLSCTTFPTTFVKFWDCSTSLFSREGAESQGKAERRGSRRNVLHSIPGLQVLKTEFIIS